MRSILSFFSFYGRARRRAYGAFSLATIPVFAIFAAAASVAVLQIYGKDLLSDGTKSGADMARSLEGLNAIPHQALFWASVVSGGIWLVMCVAWIALSVRRLHDMGGTGWITIAFVPVVFLLSLLGYLVICLVLSVWPGTKNTNRYGRNPRRPDDISDVFEDPAGRPTIAI